MKKIVLVPDSFKGTLSARGVCRAMEEGVRRVFPEARVISVPVADGGEGTVEAFLTALGSKAERITVPAEGPFGEPVSADYALLEGGVAVIEMASCAGLPLAAGRLNPESASTRGVGLLMGDAVARGAKKLVLGLGGSCTNDGGAGAAAAAGARFFRENGSTFSPTGGTLKEIARIELSPLRKAFAGVEITAMCDIDNPLYGPTGAACVFAPQKGADAHMVQRLDEGLRSLSSLTTWETGEDLSSLPGAGAAGGMGFGMAAFFGARLRSGIETVLDTVGFDSLLQGADLALTGEGSLDSQSVRGKVISGVARRTGAAGVPLVALAGRLGEGFQPLYELGLTAAFSINRAAEPLEVSGPNTAENIALVTENLMRFFPAE